MDDCACWACFHPEATHEDHLAHLEEEFRRHGWLVQGVHGMRLHAPLAYTVGLTAHGLPELVVTGRRLEVAGSMLNAVAEYTHDTGVLLPGETMHLGDAHLEVVGLPHPEAHLLVAAQLYGPAVRAVQLVWADDRGRLPWQRGHRGGRGGQPVLGPRSGPRASAG